MPYQSKLEIAIDSRSGVKSLRRVEGGLERVERAGDGVTRTTRDISSGFDRMRGVAMAAKGALLGLSVGVAGLTAIARVSSQTAAEIDNLSRLANASTDEFQRITFAAAEYGVQQEKLADILKDTNDRVGDFLSTGGGEMAEFFEQIAPQIGVTADEFRNLSGPQALQKFYNGLERANLSQAEMTFYMESIADEATALIPLLRDGGVEMDRLAGEASQLNAVLSTMEIQRLKDIRGEFHQLEQQLSVETARAVSQFDELIKSSLEGISAGINNVARGFNAFMDGFRDDEAKRSIAGIDAELNTLFDNKRRLEQRIDLFGEDNPVVQDAVVALSDLKTQYDVLIARKRELMQTDASVPEPEILSLERAAAGTRELANATPAAASGLEEVAAAANDAYDPIQNLIDRLDHLKETYVEANSLADLFAQKQLAQSLNGPQGQIVRQGIGTAINDQVMGGKPEVQGLDPLYSGPFGELQRIQQEREALSLWYAEKIQMYEQYRALETEKASQYNDIIRQLERSRAQDVVQIQQQEQMARTAGYASMFGNLANLSATFAGDSAGITRGLMAFQQAANLATTISNMAVAQSQAGASLPFPANLAAMATVAAQGAALISTIGSIVSPPEPSFSASSYSGMYDKGGMIPKGKWGIAGEYGPEIIQGPARVTSRKDTAKQLGGDTSITYAPVFQVQAQPGATEQDGQRFAKGLDSFVKSSFYKLIEKESRPGGALSKR